MCVCVCVCVCVFVHVCVSVCVRVFTLAFQISTILAEWALNPACVTQSEVIGQGEFGEVYSGVYRGTPVAIKGIHEDKQSTAALASFTREAAIMT